MAVLEDQAARVLGLAVLRQTVDDIRFRPYTEARHLCCRLPPGHCAKRFLANGEGELWCDLAGISPDAIRRRLAERQAPS